MEAPYNISMPLLSILIPVYNKEEFLEEVVQRVLSVELPGRLDREVIIVDDASTDGTAAIADALTAKYPDTIRVWHHPVNSGKGAAIGQAWRRKEKCIQS